ncbi:myb domain-containing protein [Tieghemostelium lacteum]|uniref:Myb domain-containing protein n=1 Tax=Tieghemostelium lacteum TaxID=361077 RepID=A0A151Z4B4_TIELA|nr:myb domain-containing protein [Tieghemostelium lacteum]|eukprot:KYQ88813.1 myb domain-containing protein [Tieghemostelium lacteum]
MRNNSKGGVWRNTEDEILKVAIMKYGLNQWARISSLLTRKTPAQCKARWYEWLDPSIKKIEWNREEEEMLLHLAKIFPSQWKTIASKVGRTAAQCLDHYNKLLDEVQQQQDGTSSERPQRHSEMDPNPETKPAKPDPIDMDEEEKETLSEAKARLSNTQGKKEKRKFREKQLEEARRLAFLQKKRELKAAGQYLHQKKKIERGKFDQSHEIPFFKKPQAGFYQVPDEEIINDPNKDREFIGKRVDQLEKKKYLEEQEKNNKLEELKKKKKEITNLPGLLMEVSKLNDVQQIKNRKKTQMFLPLPQLTDDDLEEIAEFERVNGGQELEVQLQQQRTKRTPMQQDNIMIEAQNLYNLSVASTPLKGGQTPHLVNTNLQITKPVNSKDSQQTPSVGKTPNPLLQIAQTPKRKFDSLQDREEIERDNQVQQQKNKSSLLESLRNLPKPKHEIKISLPDVEPEDIDMDTQSVGASSTGGASAMELDESEVHIRKQEELKHKEQFRQRNRSNVLKKNLPRLYEPVEISSSQDLIQKMVSIEMNKIIKNDNQLYPVLAVNGSGSKQKQKQQQQQPEHQLQYEYYTNKEMDQVNQLINEQIKSSGMNKDMVLNVILQELDSLQENFQVVPGDNKLVDRSVVTSKQRIETLKMDYEMIVKDLKSHQMKSQQLEKKLTVYNGGYQNRSKQLVQSIEELYSSIQKANIELNCYQDLRTLELNSLENRIKSVQHDLYDQVETENHLQLKYSKLLQEKKEILKNKVTKFLYQEQKNKEN